MASLFSFGGARKKVRKAAMEGEKCFLWVDSRPGRVDVGAGFKLFLSLVTLFACGRGADAEE